MKVGVLLKQVPATDTKIRINADQTGIVLDDIKWELNPYDEHALEEALRIKDAKKDTEVIIFCLGSSDAKQRIIEGLARGADRAIWITDKSLQDRDSLITAKALAAAVKANPVDLLLGGKQAVDGDNAQVPAMIAEILGWPQALIVSALEIGNGTFKATRDAGGGVRHVVQGSLPAVVTCDKALNQPRYSSLPGMMKARKKPMDKVKALGIEGEDVVVNSNWSLPPERPAGRILSGDAQNVVKELVELLRNEAKVI